MSNVSIEYQDKAFPEGTIAGKIYVNIVADTVPLQSFEFTGEDGQAIVYTFLAGVIYTLTAWRQSSDGSIVLGEIITKQYTGTETLSVIIRVPLTITVV